MARKPRLRVVSADDAAPRRPKTRGPILPSLGVTAKEEAFAQQVAKGASLADAFRLSHDAADMKEETLWVQAVRVNSRDRVRQRVATLLDAQQAETLHDKRRAAAWALKLLEREATQGDTAGARVAAIQTVMRYHAMLTDRTETEVTDTTTTEEMRQQLAEALAALAAPVKIRA